MCVALCVCLRTRPRFANILGVERSPDVSHLQGALTFRGNHLHLPNQSQYNKSYQKLL